MKLLMQSGSESASLTFAHWETAIIGDIVDDRGAAAHEFARKHATNVHTLSYDARTFEMTFDDTALSADELETFITGPAFESLLLETTTLGFVEMLLCCRAVRQLGQGSLSFLYTEPAEYNRPQHRRVLHRRDFDLSNDVEGFSGVPGFSFMVREDRPTRAVFLVGYEGQRLEQVLEQTAIQPSRTSIVFGVPAYQAGWEMDSFANNLRVIQEHGLRRDGALFAGAQNPLAAYRALDKVHRSLASGERLLIGPIGTKPHGIGAALFACEHPNVGIVYDHPKRSKGRSTNIGSWHLFQSEQGEKP
jgi:hypothetical protein